MPADQVLDFDALYGENCAGCHGADGKLGPAPPLNDPLFLAIVPDAELRHVIAEGRTARPPRGARCRPSPAASGGPLTDAQVKVLAEGIKTRWGTGWRPGTRLPPYLSPAGDQGAGTGTRGPACSPAPAPAATAPGTGRRGRRAAGRRHQRPGVPGADQRPGLRRIAITGRPDLGMPDLRRHGRSAGRFPAADLGGDRRPGRAAGVLEAGRAGRRPMTTSIVREANNDGPCFRTRPPAAARARPGSGRHRSWAG